MTVIAIHTAKDNILLTGDDPHEPNLYNIRNVFKMQLGNVTFIS